jgi:hypothetical protein
MVPFPSEGMRTFQTILSTRGVGSLAVKGKNLLKLTMEQIAQTRALPARFSPMPRVRLDCRIRVIVGRGPRSS